MCGRSRFIRFPRIGGTAAFDTTETIEIPPGGGSPTAGAIDFSIEGNSHSASYMSDSVVIDGESFASCDSVATCN